MSKKGILWVLAVILLVFNLMVWLSVVDRQDKVLRVAFLDVGQGDSILIESPSGVQVLVDGGPNFSVLRQLGNQMSFFDRKIDAVLATHPDADHIGGLPEVIDRFKVPQVFLTGVRKDTPVFAAYEEGVAKEGSKVHSLLRGSVLDMGGGVFAEVLFPDRKLKQDTDPNLSSIVLRLVYGETSFLLMGDTPKEIEEYLASLDGSELESVVLKVGHHGSRTSTSAAFVSAVSPEYAVISAGCDNRYGHPHKEVLENLEKISAKIISTCENGVVVFESDGDQVILR